MQDIFKKSAFFHESELIHVKIMYDSFEIVLFQIDSKRSGLRGDLNIDRNVVWKIQRIWPAYYYMSLVNCRCLRYMIFSGNHYREPHIRFSLLSTSRYNIPPKVVLLVGFAVKPAILI
jgi:hypothetical protein